MGKSEYQQWLRYAKDDLEAARYLLSMPQRKLEIICYHCQQCAEKSLKALLALQDLEIPHTHDLRLLASVLRVIYPFDDYSKQLAYLQPFAVAVRYPYEIELASGDEERAIQDATTILRYAEEVV
jgi:HEPN domain-containing protein